MDLDGFDGSFVNQQFKPGHYYSLFQRDEKIEYGEKQIHQTPDDRKKLDGL